MKKELNLRQQKFVDEYLKCLNATKAAILAGYSEKWAGSNADKLLKTTKIEAKIKESRDRIAKETEITQEYIIEKLKKIVNANIKDYLSYKTVLAKVGEVDGKPIFDYAPVIDLIDSAEVEGVPIKKVSISATGIFTFELEAKQPALESLAKHIGFYEQDNLQRSDITVRIAEMRKRGEELAEEARKGMDEEKP